MTRDEEIAVKRGCAERAKAYVDNSYWVDIEYGRDRWDIDLDDLRAAIMDGESEPAYDYENGHGATEDLEQRCTAAEARERELREALDGILNVFGSPNQTIYYGPIQNSAILSARLALDGKEEA